MLSSDDTDDCIDNEDDDGKCRSRDTAKWGEKGLHCEARRICCHIHKGQDWKISKQDTLWRNIQVFGTREPIGNFDRKERWWRTIVPYGAQGYQYHDELSAMSPRFNNYQYRKYVSTSCNSNKRNPYPSKGLQLDHLLGKLPNS